MNNLLRIIVARWLGVFSSMAVLILWIAIILAKQPQYASSLLTPGTWTVGRWIIDAVDFKMLLFALLGLLAALLKKPLLILLIFLVLFIPVGLYTLGVPGWGKWVGISTLLLAVSGFLLLSTRDKLIKS